MRAWLQEWFGSSTSDPDMSDRVSYGRSYASMVYSTLVLFQGLEMLIDRLEPLEDDEIVALWKSKKDKLTEWLIGSHGRLPEISWYECRVNSLDGPSGVLDFFNTGLFLGSEQTPWLIHLYWSHRQSSAIFKHTHV